MEKKIEELRELLNNSNNGCRKENEATQAAAEFASDYDWDCEWEAFNPIEACQDAFMAGIRFALSKLS